MKRIMVSPTCALGVVIALMLTSFSSKGNADDAMPMLTGVVPMNPAPQPNVTWHRTLRAGWQESRRRNVPMLIYISSDHCAYCDAMKRDTWCDKTVQQRLTEDFVAIHLTPKENEATLGRIKVTTYPTTLIGVPEGKVIGHRFGYQPAAALHEFLSEVIHRR